MKLERTIAGTRYIAQIEPYDDAYLVSLYCTGQDRNGDAFFRHLPAFDMMVFDYRDAEQVVRNSFAQIAIRSQLSQIISQSPAPTPCLLNEMDGG